MTNGAQNVVLFVTHAQGCGSYLKIWGQVDNTKSRKIESMINRLKERFERFEGAITPRNVLIPGSICCAFHEDNYYRAKIIEVYSNFTVHVHFIDYGNSERILPTAIRLLQSFPEALELITLPAIAYEFTIINVMPCNGSWTENDIAHIKEILTYKEHHATVTFPSRQLISLFVNGRDFSDYLLSKQMALPASPGERLMISTMCENSSQPMQQPTIYQQPPIDLSYDNRLNNNYSIKARPSIKNFSPPKMISHENWRQPHQHTLQSQQMPLSGPPPPSIQSEQSHGFINPVLEKDSIQFVIVSHIVDGPLVFSVQLQHRASELETLMNNINNHPLQSLSQRADIGTVCLARESKHNTIRRAVVSYVGDPHAAKLFYVDYGDSETLSHSRIYDIPPQYIKPLALSVRFSLSGFSDVVVTKEMKQYFQELVRNKVLTVKIQPEEFHSPLMSFGIFYLEGKNILDMLCESFPDSAIRWAKRRPFVTGSRDNITISHSDACSRFFVQLISELPTLNLLACEILEHVKIAPVLRCIATGIKCLARSTVDSQWYRAEIVNVTDNDVSVHYVDYGNDERIPRTELRSIRSEKIAKIAPLAIQCILTGFDGVTFNSQIYEKFVETAVGQQLCMLVHEIKTEALVIDLYNQSKKPIINISATLRNMNICDTNPNNKPTQWRDEGNAGPPQNQRAKRSGVKIQPLLGHQNKAKLKSVKPTREESDRWTSKFSNDSRHQSFDNSSFDSQKMGNWQNIQNDDKRFNTPDQKSGKNWMTMPQNDRFNRDNTRNERFNIRDTNPRYDRSDTNERFESDNSSNNFSGKDNRGGRDNHGGRGKGYSPNTSRFDRNSSMEKDKEWSDKDSNASSRDSGKRGGRGAARGAPRNANNSRTRRDVGSENDRLYKPPRSSGFNNKTPSTGSRYNDRRSNERNDDNTAAQIDSWDSVTITSLTEKKSATSIPQIPPPNITLGAVKHCEIVYVTSPTEFYVQLCPDNVELDEVMRKIAEIYETGGVTLPESSRKIGNGCIAQYSEDSTWYRAIIQSVESTGAIVQFVDYGNTELVTFDKIKVMKEEFVKLPTQAIGCKLLAANKSQWDTSELDRFTAIADIKPLEAEFITQQNNIYEVLLRQVVNGIAKDPYFNEQFSGGVDLIHAKEIAKNKHRPAPTTIKSYVANYASLNQKWSEPPVYFGNEEEIIITWLINPSNFYCQFTRNQKEFRSMMDDIQKVYAGREPTKESLEVGASVVAIFAEDMALYRAEIIQLNKSHEITVRYVDFGNCATVQPNEIFNVEKRFMILPKQSVNCSLKNIAPPGTTSWPTINSQEIDKLFNIEKLQCIFHETQNNKNVVTLMNNGENLAEKMVERGIAAFDVLPPCSNLPEIHDVSGDYGNMEEHLTGVDISRLTGQALRVMVSNVENVNKFHIQLPSAAANEKIVTDFMENNDTKVMPKLSQREVCLGAGCLVETYDGWRRAVVINCSRTTDIDVRFIDTGAIDVIPLDRMVALPGKLSLMQKQAIECCMKDVSSSPDNNEKLKSLVENKEVIMQVVEVKNDRLIIHLFDDTGKKIRITAKESYESICPLLPMPILFCVHRVTVPHVNHSGSVWLKCLMDTETDEALIEELYSYYTTAGRPLNVSAGKLCAAQSADGNWYRARIIEKTEKGALVHYIDYGNTEEIALDLLKELEPQFFKQSQLAIEVALTITVKGTEKEQQQILNTHLLDKEFIASIFKIDNKWNAEIMIKPGVKIGDVLSPLGVLKSETTSEEIEFDDLIVGQRYKISVCHTENPTQFWIQRKNHSVTLGLLQEKLQAEALNYPTVDGIPEEKSLCAALYSVDKMWYRAEVIDADEEMVTLRFIDYGNTDTILDLAGSMKHLPDEMKSIAPYATKCRLDLIPSGDDWTEEACSRFATLTTHVNMNAIVIADGNIKRVELFFDENSVNDILVKENHALKLQANEEMIDEVVEIELDPRSAFVSHINSPNEFWVQEERCVANLELIADRFLVADMFPKVDEIKEGLLCVAKYPEDMSWYRARVISYDDNGTNVIYIDYGNSAVSTEIRAIPEDVAAISPLSRKCCLLLPPGIEKWSDDACQKFCVMSDEGATIFLMDVIEDGETSKVKLTLEGKDIVDELIAIETSESSLSCVEESRDTIPVGDIVADDMKDNDEIVNEEVKNETMVFVSQVTSPSEFWIQEENSVTNLDIVAEQLVDISSYEKMDETEMKEGELCIAQFPEDSYWYRARVISHGDTGTNVLFIDYGNSAIATEVRKIPEKLTSIPPLSTKCSLALPPGISQWSNECCQEFFKLVDNGAAKFGMNIIAESETSTVKLTLNSLDVAHHLSELCEKYVPIIEERLPPLGEENSPTVVVSHVISPADFWIQAENQIPELEVMADHIANAANFLPLNTVEEGTICAAEFPEDGNWYRAKILCHNESETEVLYIDYGNSAITRQIRALPEDIVKIPPLSKPCALQMPDEIVSWSKEACEKFIDLVADGETMFEYKEYNDEERTHVSLQLKGQDVVEILLPLCKIAEQTKAKSASIIPVAPAEIQQIIEKCTIVEKCVTTEIDEGHGDKEQLTIVSDVCSPQTHDKSLDVHSSITSDVDIQTMSSDESAVDNNVSAKFETFTESTNSTFEKVTVEYEDTCVNSVNTIDETIPYTIKVDTIVEEAVDHNVAISYKISTDEPRADENIKKVQVASANDIVEKAKVNDEKIISENDLHDTVSLPADTISESTECNSSVCNENVVQDVINEPQNPPVNVIVESPIIKTTEHDSITNGAIIVQDTVTKPGNLTVNGTQLMEAKESIGKIEHTADIPKTSIETKTPLLEQSSVIVVTDDNSFTDNQGDEVIVIESVKTSAS